MLDVVLFYFFKTLIDLKIGLIKFKLTKLLVEALLSRLKRFYIALFWDHL